MGKVNIQRLATELNLSIATVSRALRHSHQIRPETREKVWELARKLNYQPNPFASGLRGQKSKHIAVVFPELANTFFSLAINGIEEIAREKNYHVLIYLTHESADSEKSFIDSLSNGRVDGLLISLSSQTTEFSHIDALRKKLPVILFDRVYPSEDILHVATDDYNSSFEAANHLLQQGCKKILYLQALRNLPAGKMRLEGFKDALIKAGIRPEEHMIIGCDGDEKATMACIQSALAGIQPDGVFSSIEKLGIYCYQAAAALRLRIPQDLKVVSFSNLDTAALLNPPMTTITQPAFEIGKEAAALLFQQLEKKKIGLHNKVIPSQLICRASTAAN